MAVKRQEYFSLDAANATFTPEGFLRVPMTATRTGVFTYFHNDKPFRELRLPEEVFSQDSMNSLAMKPITSGHPYQEPDAMVTPKNVRRLQVGMVGENIAPVENRYLRAMAIITDEAAIKEVKAGKKQVSCGYVKEIDFTPGFWDGTGINQDGRGEQFDAIQRNIRYNHVAIVNRGRAGEEVRLNLDEDYNQIEEGNMLVKITLDGKEFEVSAEVAENIKALHAKALDEATKRKEAEAKIANDSDSKLKMALDENVELKKENEKLKGSLDAKDAIIKDLQDPVKFAAKVQKRTQLLTAAKSLMGLDSEEDEKKAGLDSLSDLDVMKAALKKTSPDLNLDGKDESYICGRFDTLVESLDSGEKKKSCGGGTSKLGEKLHSMREGGKSMDNADNATKVAQLAQSRAYKYSMDELKAGKHFADAKKELGIE